MSTNETHFLLLVYRDKMIKNVQVMMYKYLQKIGRGSVKNEGGIMCNISDEILNISLLMHDAFRQG